MKPTTGPAGREILDTSRVLSDPQLDYEVIGSPHLLPDPADLLEPETGSISSSHLSAILHRMFEFAPIAMSITTSDTRTSSYAKVNDAYLKLVGRSWEEISGKRLTDSAAIDNPARDRRHRLLTEQGCYELEEVDITHADGTVIPTLISAQRTVINGVSFDVEVLMDVSSRVRQQREIENALKTSARTDALSGLPNRAGSCPRTWCSLDGHGSSQRAG